MKYGAVYLRHILECIQRIEEYITVGKENFLLSHLIQDATLRNLQIMSESTQRLSESLKASQPQILWARVAGFRNVLVHDYLGINVEHVWTVIETDLPSLKQATISMLSSQ